MCLQDPKSTVVKNLSVVSKVQLQGEITSISLDVKGKQGHSTLVYVGSNTGNMYQIIVNFQTGEFMEQLVQSAHPASVSAVAFAEMYGEVSFWNIVWEGVIRLQTCGRKRRGALPSTLAI